MKRTAVVTVITAVIIALAAIPAIAVPYFVYGRVYNPDGTSGTAATANSNASFSVFREGIPGQIGKQNSGPDALYPKKIYPAFYNSVNTPAYAYSDAGSSDWSDVPAAAQVVIGVYEVYAGQFTWNGNSYMACTKTSITAASLSGSETDLSDVTLRQIPAPSLSGSGLNYADLSWTGMDMDLITGYTVFRSTNIAGAYTAISYTASQNRNGSVVFTDDGVTQGNTYYYKIAVNVEWGGGGGAPAFFMTDAKSSASLGIYIGSTPTITATVNVTVASQTDTPVNTATFTPTFTPTLTSSATATYTETATPQDTQTYTPTITVTDTDTVTVTLTHTVTSTLTLTPTITQTPAITPTFTCTPAETSAPAVNILSEKLVVLNSPIKNGRLQLGLLSDGTGTAFLRVYNVSGELVYREVLQVSAGTNKIDREFKKARGIYILRVVVKTTVMRQLPIRKFAVIKNNY